MRVNTVFLSGRLTRKPETKTVGGNVVTNFALAHSPMKKGEDGKWTDGEPSFIDVAMWGPRGEAFAQFHGKGDMALVEGELRQDSWTDRESGGKRSRTYVQARAWHFCAKSPGGSREGLGSDEAPFG